MSMYSPDQVERFAATGGLKVFPPGEKAWVPEPTRAGRDDRFMCGPGLIITKKDGSVRQLSPGPREFNQER